MNTTINAFGRIALAVFLSTLLAVTAASAQTTKRRSLTPTPAATATTTAPATTTAAETDPVTETEAAATDTATTDTATTDTATTDTAATDTTSTAPPPTDEELFDAMSSDEKLKAVWELSEVTAKGNDLNGLSSNLQWVWTRNTDMTRKGMSQLQANDRELLARNNRTNNNLKTVGTYLKYAFGLVFVLLVMMFVFMFVFFLKTSKSFSNVDFLLGEVYTKAKEACEKASGIVPAFIIGLLSLGIVSQQVYAAPAPCSITRISSGSIVVKEQDPAVIKIAVRNCDVKQIESVAGVAFTEVAQKGNTVTAKVAASPTALTGPVAFKVKLADGSEVESPEGVDLEVFDLQTAVANKRAQTANANALKVAKDLKATTANLRAEITARPTKAEMEARISPIEARLCDIEKVVASLLAESQANAARVAVLGQGMEVLANNDIAFGNAKVKKSFWGGASALNPEAAEAAARILSAVGNTAELEPIVEAKQQ